MIAKYDSNCRCGARVTAGSSVKADRVNGKFTVLACPSCEPGQHQTKAESIELRLKITRVGFARPDGTWTAADATLAGPLPADADLPISAQGQRVAVVGPLGDLHIGDTIDAYGSFAQDAKYGWQFRADRAVHVVGSSDQDLVAYLTHFPQIGKKRAEQLLQLLGGGEAVLQALKEDPQALTVCPGITAERAQEISATYVEMTELNQSAMFLAKLGLGQAMTAQLLEAYAGDTLLVLEEDPYQLMELRGVGFLRADEVATKINELAQRENRPAPISPDDPRRLAAAVLSRLEEIARDGHTFCARSDL